MSLNPEQREAAEYLEGPLLVLAGPGTGKTQLLSAKVQYILEHTDAGAANILCLTFTEAGADNMRDRLRSMIGKAADDVNIYTYHAFGRSLLERYQNYTEHPDRKIEGVIDDTTKYKLASNIIHKLPPADILHNANPVDIIETIGSSKSAQLSPADLEKIAEQNLSDSEALSAEISPILETAKRGAKVATAIPETYEPILEILANYISKIPITRNIERIANTMTRELNRLIEEARETGLVSNLTKWKTNTFEKKDDGSFRLKDTISNKKLLSLSKVMASYEAEMAKRGLFDFDDMIQLTIQHLKEDTGFRLSLSELFQYILLDEFQDTNSSQFELIKLLTDYERPCIMAVGDDDQAIYEFQGANASNLLDFQEHYDAKTITLTKNYRSTEEILELSRHIADQIDDSFTKNFEGVSKKLTSMKETNHPNTTSQISRHEFPCAEAEYYWVATKIRELIEQGEDPNEIAVLAPKHKNLVAILPYLKDQNIEISYEKRDNLLQDPIIHEIISIALFVQDLASSKQSSHRLFEILSYEFWQVSTLDVVNLFAERRPSKTTLELLSSNDKLAPLAQFFADLVAKSFTAPLELWLDYVIGRVELNGFQSPFLKYYENKLTESELLEFYENLATFRQAVTSYMRTTQSKSADLGPRLSDFVTMIQDYESAGSEIMRISNYRDSSRSVQVMTAFKSKGLEFKHVFLTAVDNLAWGRSKGNNNFLVLPRNLTQIRHTGVSDDERLRVFFVALTRAKESLTLTSSRQDSAGKTNARLTYLSESSFEESDPISPYLPVSAQKIQFHNDLDTATKIETLCLDWASRYQNLTPEAEPIMQSRVDGYRLTASDLTSFIDLVYAGPQKIYRRLILHVPDEPSTPEQSYGTLAHAVFEQITSQKLDTSAALELFRSLVPHTTLDEEDQRRLLETGTYNLKSSLDEFDPILRHEHARAEVNLSNEHLNYEGIPVTGKIDHLHIDPNTKTIEIYDYKTGKYHSGKWDSCISLYKYRMQLGFYKLLLNLSPNYRNYKVTSGHILFVTPDNEGRVYDKIYEYNEKDDQELRKLCKKIYQLITTLEFMKNPEIFLPSDQNNTITKVRQFVASLIEE